MPESQKTLKLICFDVDDTLTEGIIWERLTRGFGWSWDKHKERYKQRLSGKYSFAENHAYIVGKWKETGNTNKKFIDGIVAQTQLKPFARELMDLLRKNGFTIHLISGGIKAHVQHVADLLGIEGYSASVDFVFDGKGEMTDLINIESQKLWKVDELKKVSRMYDIPLDQIYLVGDGENDVEIFKLSKRAIAVETDNTEILSLAWRKVQSLKEIGSILELDSEA